MGVSFTPKPANYFSFWTLGLNRRPVTYFLTALFVALAIYSWWFTRGYFNEKAKMEMASRALRVESALKDRLEIYTNTLNYLLGSVRNNRHLDPKTFAHLIEDIKIGEKYPGFQGVGIAKAYPRMAADGTRYFYAPITHVAPSHWRNQRVVGMDIYANPILRHTAELAVAQNTVAMSAPVYMAQETEVNRQLGFVLILPNLRESSKQVTEFIFMSFRSLDFFEKVFDPADRKDDSFDFVISGADFQTKAPMILYHKLESPPDANADTALSTIEVAGQRWEIHYYHAQRGIFFWKTWIPPAVAVATFFLLLITLYTFISTHNYMHEQEQLTRSLEEAERQARAANRAKNAFLANMSHEIRTPLGAIMGFSEILASKRISSSEQKKIHESIRRNGMLLVRLIDDILDLAKIEAEKLTIKKAYFDLPSLIFEVRSIMEPRTLEKKISLSFGNLSAFPEVIYSDEVRIKQVLINLIGNAIKFTKHGSVDCRIDFAPSPEDSTFAGKLSFYIQDSGIGISEEAQKEVFQPFSQGDVAYTRAYGGSGLGLTLSKRISESLRGELTLISSVVNEGSLFKFSLPVECSREKLKLLTELKKAAEESPNPTTLDGDQSYALAGTRILLAEDSPDNQEIFQLFLETAGAQVTLCQNGLDVIRKMEESSGYEYDLILMDIQMPYMDGKEATRRLRQLGYRLPIVALTAHVTEEEKQSCLDVGCDGQITKPVNFETLVRGVKLFALRPRENLKELT